MAPTLEQLFTSPDHFLHAWDGGNAVFVPMDRAAYQRSIFLDRRISPAGEETMSVPIAKLLQGDCQPLGAGWIFHVAHCGSTLLARALDGLADNLVLREPLALRQQAFADDPAQLKLTLALLSKRYPGAGQTVIKANVPVNFLLTQIAAADPGASAVFLHLSLSDYLLAILRSDNHRAWLRGVTQQLALHLGEIENLTDAKLAAALWLAMVRRFAGAIDAMPNGRSLDAERFFSDPRQVLEQVAKLYGMAATPAALDAVVSGPLFSTYSKNPAHAFDNEARLERRADMAEVLGDEIAEAQNWIERNAPDAEDLAKVIKGSAL
jgi:hypothetical protein